MRWFRILLKQARRIALAAILGGLLAATLVRFSPGFGADVEDLSVGLSQESHAAIRAQRMADSNIVFFYGRYLTGTLRGDLGFARSLNRPVSELLKERLPQTVASVGWGMVVGIALAIGLALATVFWGSRAADAAADAWSGLLLSIPAAALALLFLWTGADGKWAIALLVFPHIYRYAKNVLLESATAAHVLSARARGVSAVRVLFAHIVRPALPQLLAAAGVSSTLAFGAAIPVEAICDSPGVGQLAWKAALGRDLPLLVTITVLVALMTMIVNSAADLLAASLPGASDDGER
jgi:peptide/nickel transport system permease protein